MLKAKFSIVGQDLMNLKTVSDIGLELKESFVKKLFILSTAFLKLIFDNKFSTNFYIFESPPITLALNSPFQAPLLSRTKIRMPISCLVALKAPSTFKVTQPNGGET